MWSCNRRWFLFSAAAVGGCGFTPVYGPNGIGHTLRGQVQIDTPDTPDTYRLVRYIEERLGHAPNPVFGLSYSLGSREEGLAVTASQIIERYNILGDLSYALRRLDDMTVVASGKVSGMTAYSASGTTVATRAAQRDAYERLMVLLGDRMITQLLMTLPKGAA